MKTRATQKTFSSKIPTRLPAWAGVALGASALALSACQGSGGSSEQSLTGPAAVTPGGRVYDSANLSCNPFGGDEPIYYNLGLAAKMYYLTPDQPQYTQLADYFAHGKKHAADFFFTDLNVPTRHWSAGFPSAAGPLLRSDEGEVLKEWFALRYDSVLRLGRGEVAGKYQLAMLSDDGSILKLDTDGTGKKPFISSDGLQSTKLTCASKSIFFDNSTHIPMQLDYYQGPRDHIAVMMLWREIPMSSNEESDPSVLADPLCGMMSNTRWFDYSVSPSAPKVDFINLLNRGWRIMPADNFVLPVEHPENPCCVSCGIGV